MSNIYVKNWKLIAAISLVGASLGVGASLAMPNKYTSDAKLMVPQGINPLALLSSGGNSAMMASMMSVNPLKNPADIYVGLLKSRNVQDRIISSLKLEQRLESVHLDAARSSLDSMTKISTTKENLLSIAVTTKDPKLSQAIAQGYVDGLFSLNSTLNTNDGKDRRVQLDKDMAVARAELDLAQETLSKVQQKTGIVDITANTSTDFMTAVALEGQLAALQSQKATLVPSYTSEHPQIIALDKEIARLKSRIDTLKNGQENRLSSKFIEYVNAYRDFKVKDAVVEQLNKQIALAKLDENGSVEAIKVVDLPTVPFEKSGPHRTLIVMASLFFSFASALAWVKLKKSK